MVHSFVRNLVLCCLAVAVLTPVSCAQPSHTINLPRVRWASGLLPQFAEDAMKRGGTAGMAIAVVYQDQLVYADGFGFRKVGQPAKIDADTVFQVASVSKAVASTVLGVMVTKGLITWDDLIADLDPSFELSDPWVTSRLSIRDLMSHRSGLHDHAGDLLEDIGYGREEVLRRLRFVSPLGRFRQAYAYTNFGLTEAGVAAAKKANSTWEQVSDEFLYQPLGMTSTSSRHADYVARANRAWLHVPVNGKPFPQFDRQPDAQSPAGGVSSSIHDLAKWMRMILSGGKVGGETLIASNVLTEMQSPQILRGVNPETGAGEFYGIGWNVSYDNKGRLKISHSGAFSLGAGTTVAMFPRHGVGIAILTNSFPNGIAEAMADTFFDILDNGLSRDGKLSQDWPAIWMERYAQATADPISDYSKLPQPDPTPAPPLSLAAYAGTYESDFYGPITVAVNGNSLTMRLGPQQTSYALEHWEKDTFTYFFSAESGTARRAVFFSEVQDGRPQKMLVDNFRADGPGILIRSTGGSRATDTRGSSPARDRVGTTRPRN